MAKNIRGLTVPSGGEAPRRAALNELADSINDITRVPNNTARDQLIADLTAADQPTKGILIFNEADNGYYVRAMDQWHQVRTSADDTGWVNVNLSSGYTATEPIRVRRIDKTVYWQGRVSRTAGNFPVNAQATISIGGVPTQFRPAGSGPAARVTSNGANSTAYVTVDSAGSIYLVPLNAAGQNYHLGGLSGYTVD